MNPLRSGPLKQRNQQRQTPDYSAMKMLSDFLTSNAGLITRHVLATATPILTAWAASAVQHGIPGQVAEPLLASSIAALAWLVQIGLSRLADKANKALEPAK